MACFFWRRRFKRRGHFLCSLLRGLTAVCSDFCKFFSLSCNCLKFIGIIIFIFHGLSRNIATRRGQNPVVGTDAIPGQVVSLPEARGRGTTQ